MRRSRPPSALPAPKTFSPTGNPRAKVVIFQGQERPSLRLPRTLPVNQVQERLGRSPLEQPNRSSLNSQTRARTRNPPSPATVFLAAKSKCAAIPYSRGVSGSPKATATSRGQAQNAMVRGQRGLRFLPQRTGQNSLPPPLRFSSVLAPSRGGSK